MSDPVLIAAVSGRALAAAARRAGLRPYVVDFFGDDDTRRLTAGCVRVAGSLAHGFDASALLAAADAAGPMPLVYGSGFEARPQLLARLAQDRHLWGNRPETVARVKDPRPFFALADRLGIPHPPNRFTSPPDPAGWLVKRIGGAGGGHVRPARAHPPAPDGMYYQRRMAGRPVSVLFLANGSEAKILGLSEQWSARSLSDRRYVFGGAAAPANVDPGLATRITDAVSRLVAAIGLVGLNSADLLLHADGFALLEINPRPGATLDIFDRGGASGVFAAHCAACDGHLPARWTPSPGAAASAIVYARRGLRIPYGFTWPRWAADRSPAGTRIACDKPVCTVFARAATTAAARARVAQRSAEIWRRLEERAAAKPVPRGEAARSTARS